MKDKQTDNPVTRASRIGQSIWLDFLSRELMHSGRLREYIDAGLRGITSNPKIFSSAISEGKHYDRQIERLAREGKTAVEIYEAVAVQDIQAAADALLPHFREGLPQDGFVSLEVSPRLAHDAEGTIEEARRLWRAVNRPNVLIKVPATQEGLEAIRRLIAEGVSVNVTLLFSLSRYRQVADAYIEGLEEALTAGRSVETTYSVASFFLSRIDVLVDAKLDELIEKGKADAEALRGRVAIASAKLAYRACREIFDAERFQRIERRGARRQPLLWGSTSVKDPSYDELKYANALIGPGTVDTLPEDTIRTFLERGEVSNVLRDDIDRAGRVLKDLEKTGIDLADATDQLLREGVDKFNKPVDELINSLEVKIAA